MKNHQNFEARNDNIFAIINLLSLLQMIALVKYFSAICTDNGSF